MPNKLFWHVYFPKWHLQQPLKRGTNVLANICIVVNSSENLTEAQNELYGWIKNYMKNFQHSPSIRQMMQAMGLKSPAPIQSRLKHLQEKRLYFMARR